MVGEPLLDIRAFEPSNAAAVCELFVTVNRLLAPPHLREAFEAYIVRARAEEIDRISDYYAERQGSFWVATTCGQVAGMFGVEPAGRGAMELRRMYVSPTQRRRGIARKMLQFAEDECRRRGSSRLELSTSELQGEALALYRSAGYVLVREEVAETSSNKTLGGGICRHYFAKQL
jgi:putative acetyltransferase